MKDKKTRPAQTRIRRDGNERRRARWGWFFILPWFIGTVYFFVIPMVQAAIYAFNDVTMVGGTTQFEYVGFKNFIDLFSGNANFLPDLTEALLTMLYEVPVILVFSLLIAMVLRGSFKGNTFFRATFFFPVIIASGVVITILRTQVMMTDSATSAQQQAYMFNLPDFQVLTTLFGLRSSGLHRGVCRQHRKRLLRHHMEIRLAHGIVVLAEVFLIMLHVGFPIGLAVAGIAAESPCDIVLQVVVAVHEFLPQRPFLSRGRGHACFLFGGLPRAGQEKQEGEERGDSRMLFHAEPPCLPPVWQSRGARKMILLGRP